MVSRLRQRKVDDVWRSGFCRTTVEFARRSPDGIAGAEARLEFLQQHLEEGCEDCYFANMLKGKEAEVAAQMGLGSLDLFRKGGDVTMLPGFQAPLKRAMLALHEEIKKQHGSEALLRFVAWMERAAKRTNYRRKR